MKYIRTKDGVIVFPMIVAHKEMEDRIGERVTSAGFVKQDKNKNLICFGRSESLGIKSDPEDTLVLQIQIKIMEEY